MAEIVCYIYIFHLTRLMPLHYLVKGGCSEFLPNSGGFDGSDLVSKFRGHTIVTTFLLGGPLPDMHRLSGDDFLCFNMMAPRHIEHATPSLSCSETETESHRLSACVRVRGTHFEHKF